jgi:hypothetical protein
MPRYIIECDDPTDIILGMKAIKSLIKSGDVFGIIEFEDDSLWVVKKTKTGYSARTAGGQKDA